VLPAITGGGYVYTATGGAINLGSSVGYFRLDANDGTGRIVMRRPLKLPATPTVFLPVMQQRAPATDALLANLNVMTNRAIRIGVGSAATILPASESAVLAVSTQYFVELAVTPGTTTTNGRVEYLITDSNNVTVDSYDTGATVNTGTVEGGRARFGGYAATAGFTQDTFDGAVRVGFLPAGQWIGPLGATTLTATVSLTPVTGDVPISTTATVTATGGTGTAKTYAFNWGDGSTTAAQASPTVSHTYTVAGNYTVAATVANT
jgi:PKD repeat protein